MYRSYSFLPVKLRREGNLGSPATNCDSIPHSLFPLKILKKPVKSIKYTIVTQNQEKNGQAELIMDYLFYTVTFIGHVGHVECSHCATGGWELVVSSQLNADETKLMWLLVVSFPHSDCALQNRIMLGM